MLRRLLVVLLLPLGILSAAFALLIYLLDIPKLIETYKPVALEAASQALNREVTIKDVQPSWFPVLGVRVEGLSIGDLPLNQGISRDTKSEVPDFVRLGAVEVGVAVWPALVSFGRNIRISQLKLEEPRIRVVRLPDGSFNFDTIATATTAGAKPSEDGSPSVLDRLESASIGLVSVINGTVLYDDQTTEGVGKVRINKVDFSAKKVGLGRPVQAELSAAIQETQEHNVRIRVETKPLPTRLMPFLVPGIERVEIQASHVPLSLMTTKTVDLSNASLSSEVVINASDSEALEVAGPVTVHQLRLLSAQSPPGKPLTAELQLDLRLPTTYSQLHIRDSQVRVASFAGRIGGTLELQPELSWKDLRLATLRPFSVSELLQMVPGDMPMAPKGQLALQIQATGNMKGQRAKLTSRWSRFAYEQSGLATSGAVTLTTTVQGSLQQPRFAMELDLSALSVEGEGFTKPAGMKMRIDTSGQVNRTAVEFDTALYLGEAHLDVKGKYPLGNKDLEARLLLHNMNLHRFLQSLQLPAETLADDVTFEAQARYSGDVANPSKGQLMVPHLVLVSGKSRLKGTVSTDRLDPLQAKIVASAPYLDLDHLLPTTSKKPPKQDTPESEGPLLPDFMKKAVVSIRVDVDKLRYQGLDMSDVDVNLLLSNGVLELKNSTLRMFGGKLVGTGTKVDLGKETLEYDLKTRVEKVQGGKMLDFFLGSGQILTGLLNSDVEVSGQGSSLALVTQFMSGEISLGLTNGRLDGVNLLMETLGPLANAVKVAQSRNLKLGPKGVTEFRKLRGRVYLDGGRAVLRTPIVLSTSKGDIRFTGGLNLDGSLALDGSFGVKPPVISELTGGKLRLSSELPLKFEVGCVMAAPCVRKLNLSAATQKLARALAAQGLRKVTKPIGKKLGVDTEKLKKVDHVKTIVGQPGRAAEEARKKVDEAKKKAQQKASQKVKDVLDSLF
ncbi:MAG: AsmA family protein [Myxococcales bacterium]|nr:AsmA family protein [Myxococcales bacterium]